MPSVEPQTASTGHRTRRLGETGVCALAQTSWHRDCNANGTQSADLVFVHFTRNNNNNKHGSAVQAAWIEG
jgi:hypothetical protein